MNNPSPVGEDAVHHPSLKEPEPGALCCFLDKDRFCGPECMSWQRPPPGPDYQDQQWANCLLLVSAHRGGKHLVVLAASASELVKKSKDEAADRARAQQPPPPPVR
jgi:hypothetical protein